MALDIKKFTKNPVFLIGGVVALGIVYYEYSKAKKTASANAAATTAATVAGTSTDPSIDPTTGLSYASEDYSPATGGAYGIPATGGSTVNINPATTSNSGWVQAATQALVALQYDPQAIASALGAYISGAGLTADQLQIVQAALGQEGNPPVAVPAPTLATSSGQSGTSTTSVTNGASTGGVDLTVPDVTGDIYQDDAIAKYPYVASAYAAYKANPTAATQQAYLSAYGLATGSKSTTTT